MIEHIRIYFLIRVLGEIPKPSISIEGVQTQTFPNPNSGLYQFENLGPGNYPIYIHWGDCIEYHSVVTIQESSSCPSCFDGVKNGDEEYIDCGGAHCIPCDECQSFLAINANYIDENMLFQTSDEIQIKGLLDENLEVDIKAPNEVLIKPDFEVSINSVFHAYVEDCN